MRRVLRGAAPGRRSESMSSRSRCIERRRFLRSTARFLDAMVASGFLARERADIGRRASRCTVPMLTHYSRATTRSHSPPLYLRSNRSKHERLRRRHHRRRTRRLRRRDPRRTARAQHRLRRDGQDARRHVRERRLHSVEGAAHVVRAFRVRAARTPPSTASASTESSARSRDDAEAQGRRRRRRTRRGSSSCSGRTRSRGRRGAARSARATSSRSRAPTARRRDYQAKNVIIATGSVPIELPFLKFDEERVLSNVGALTDSRSSQASHRHRRRRHRPRARLRVAPARREGHGRRAGADDPAGHGRRRREGSRQDLPQAGARDPHRRRA